MNVDTPCHALVLALIYCGGFIAITVIAYTLITTKGWRQ